LPNWELFKYEFDKFYERLKVFTGKIHELAENLKMLADNALVFATHGTLGLEYNFENFEIPKEIAQHIIKLLEQTFKDIKYVKVVRRYPPVVDIIIKVTYAEDQDQYDLIEV